MGSGFISRQISVFIIILSIVSSSAMAFSLQSLSLHRWLDSILTNSFGSEMASDWYQEKTHEMLTKLGIKNSSQVPVRQLNVTLADDAQVVHLDKWLALTGATGIWVNEFVLAKLPEEARLWCIAHETGHYKLGHGWQFVFINEIVKKIPIVSSIVFAGSREYAFQKNCEHQADLVAAEMLCNSGRADIVEHHIIALKKIIDSGIFMLNGYNHPTFQEQYAYLNKFWGVWLSKHSEYKLIYDDATNNKES